MNKKRLIFLLVILSHSFPVLAELIVLKARGGGFKIGQVVSGKKGISLKEGERVTFIGPDGRTVKLRGPFEGLPVKKTVRKVDPGEALAILVASRDARTSSIGVIRAGTDTVRTPDPSAIDISRGGPRCIDEGEKPEFWRPDASFEAKFIMFPVDRSWRADLVWEKGQNRMIMPDLSKFEGVTTVLVNIDQQEFAISFSTIPKSIKKPFVKTAWMLEKGCIQQANALLEILSSSNKK